MNRVYITGIGILTPIGLTFAQNLQNLRAGKTGIGKARFFDSKYTADYAFGELQLDTEAILGLCNLNPADGYSRTDALAFRAFQQAIADARLSGEKLADRSTAFISASTVGGMNAHQALMNDAGLPEKHSAFLHTYPYASHSLRVARHYGMKGFTNTINTACSSSANAIIMGAKMILSGRAQRAIVGGADSLSRFTVNGFNALRILSDEACKPFDETRKGLTLGEGAAYLVLESEKLASKKKSYACLSGFGNAGDAYHHSSLSPQAEGPLRAMREALSKAGLQPESIDYVNTHGTGTENNDAVELYALSELFKKIPPFNATKSYTGHLLGAASAAELVFSIMSLINNELYPSLNCNKPIRGYHTSPIESYRKQLLISHVLSNSFGFGGNCTTLICSKTQAHVH